MAVKEWEDLEERNKKRRKKKGYLSRYMWQRQYFRSKVPNISISLEAYDHGEMREVQLLWGTPKAGERDWVEGTLLGARGYQWQARNPQDVLIHYEKTCLKSTLIVMEQTQTVDNRERNNTHRRKENWDINIISYKIKYMYFLESNCDAWLILTLFKRDEIYT